MVDKKIHQNKGDNNKINKVGKKQTIVKLPSLISIIAGILSTLFIMLIIFMQATMERIHSTQARMDSVLIKFEKSLMETRLDIELIQEQLRAPASIPKDTEVALKLSELRTELNQLISKVSNFEELIIENPLKVLEIPILRKDIDNIQENYRENLRYIRDDISRVYSLNIALMVSIFTIAGGLLGSGIISLFRTKKVD
ncbi:MAG: hypothetical protein ACETWC_07055 [Acidobacteriota bacterium]